MDFTVNTEVLEQSEFGRVAILEPCGAVDQKSVPLFEAVVKEEVYRQNICYVIIDLSKTKSINSTGLGLLINITHQIGVAGGGICLINVADRFKVLFNALGLESRLPIHNDRESALNSFKN